MRALPGPKIRTWEEMDFVIRENSVTSSGIDSIEFFETQSDIPGPKIRTWGTQFGLLAR